MRQILLVSALILCASAMAGAKTVTLQGEGASVDLPDTWQLKTQQADTTTAASTPILSALSPEKTSMVQIQVCGNPHNLFADRPELVTNIKDDISNPVVAHGGQVQFTSEGKVEINNVPAYQLQYSITGANPRPILAHNYQLAANGKLYLISVRTIDTAADAGLQAIVNSFRFDSPPELPKAPVSHRWLKITLAAVAAVIVLGGLGFGYYYYQQQQMYV